MGLKDLIDKAIRGERFPQKAVAFTVDDGYFDFAEVAAPIFSHYDCPVTVFLVTGSIARF